MSKELSESELNEKIPVLLPNGVVEVISTAEKEALDVFIRTQDAQAAAVAGGMSTRECNLFLKSKRLKSHIGEKVNQIARKNDITLERVLSRLHQVAMGDLEVSKTELKALEILAKYLNIIKPPQTMNLTYNTTEKDVSEKDLEQGILDRAKWIEMKKERSKGKIIDVKAEPDDSNTDSNPDTPVSEIF